MRQGMQHVSSQRGDFDREMDLKSLMFIPGLGEYDGIDVY